jgi:ketosteroid isomerase-like protein
MKYTRMPRPLFAVIVLAASAAVSGAATNSRSMNPAETAQAFHGALAAGDAAIVKALLDPEVLIFEAGNIERSLDEYEAHHLPADLKFMSSVTYTQERQIGHTEGDLAWISTEGRMKAKGVGPERIGTETLILRKRADEWRIVHIHWSSREVSKGA